MLLHDDVKVVIGENKGVVGEIIAILGGDMYAIKTSDGSVLTACERELEIKLTDKEQVLSFIENPEITGARNRMGCDENWYNPLFSVSHTFTKEEIEEMPEKEVSNLVKLAEMIGNALY